MSRSLRPLVHAFAECRGLSLIALALAQSACEPIILGDRPNLFPAASDSTPDSSVSHDAGADSSQPAASADSSTPETAVDGSVAEAGRTLPIPGAVVWSSNHETGDLSEWEQGGVSQGGAYYWGTGKGSIVEGAGRNGSRALSAEIDTTPESPSHGARFYRRLHSEDAFYSAWFRLAEVHTVNDWWAIFLFHARDASLSLDNYRSLWDVRIVEGDGGNMTLQFLDHHTGETTSAAISGGVTVDRWFEIRTYLEYRPPNATRLMLWLDGALLFEMTELQTAMETNVFWIVGNGASGLTPTKSIVYVDDASIAATQKNP